MKTRKTSYSKIEKQWNNKLVVKSPTQLGTNISNKAEKKNIMVSK